MDSRIRYLDVVDRSVVASVALSLVARGRERVGVERDEGATTRVGDVDVCDRDWEGGRRSESTHDTRSKMYTHRVWSLK